MDRISPCLERLQSFLKSFYHFERQKHSQYRKRLPSYHKSCFTALHLAHHEFLGSVKRLSLHCSFDAISPTAVVPKYVACEASLKLFLKISGSSRLRTVSEF